MGMDKKKIFIIDDDLTFLKFVTILFEKENYYVITDRNTSDVCHKIKQSRPDIVLLDLLMPNNTGFQIFKQMKKDDYCSKIPVVVLTSHQNFNSKIQLLREGVLDYIYKPFHKEELMLRMRNYIHYCTNEKFKRDKIVQQKIFKYQILNADSKDKEENKPKFKSIIQNKQNTNHSSRAANMKDAHVYYGNINFVHKALKETNVPYVLPISFNERISKEIRFAELDRSEITVMSVGIENLYQLTLKLKSEVIIKIFKGILHTIIKHSRPQDVLSFNSEKHRFLIMLPNTHLKIAKIIAERIQQKLDRFRTSFPLEINLASYPQDGKNVDEIFAMLELGIEKIDNEAFA
jgi:PleD family two-component response regulator